MPFEGFHDHDHHGLGDDAIPREAAIGDVHQHHVEEGDIPQTPPVEDVLLGQLHLPRGLLHRIILPHHVHHQSAVALIDPVEDLLGPISVVLEELPLILAEFQSAIRVVEGFAFEERMLVIHVEGADIPVETRYALGLVYGIEVLAGHQLLSPLEVSLHVGFQLLHHIHIEEVVEPSIQSHLLAGWISIQIPLDFLLSLY